MSAQNISSFIRGVTVDVLRTWFDDVMGGGGEIEKAKNRGRALLSKEGQRWG